MGIQSAIRKITLGQLPVLWVATVLAVPSVLVLAAKMREANARQLAWQAAYPDTCAQRAREANVRAEALADSAYRWERLQPEGLSDERWAGTYPAQRARAYRNALELADQTAELWWKIEGSTLHGRQAVDRTVAQRSQAALALTILSPVLVLLILFVSWVWFGVPRGSPHPAAVQPGPAPVPSSDIERQPPDAGPVALAGSQPVDNATLLRLSSYIGPNWDSHFRSAFARLLSARGGRANSVWTWNWAAALWPVWFLYRRLYLAFFEFFVLFALITILDRVVAGTSEGGSAMAFLFIGQVILQGFMADRLLLRKAHSVVTAHGGTADSADLQRLGAPRRVWVWITLALMGAVLLTLVADGLAVT